MPTNSPRRSRARPIESVEFTVKIRSDGKTASRIQAAVPSARYRAGRSEIVIRGETPAEVKEAAQELLEKLRPVIGSPERL